MTPKPEPAVRAAYSDLLDGDDAPAMLRLAQVLDAGYNLQRAPAAVRSSPPRHLHLDPRTPAAHVPLAGIAHDTPAARERPSFWSRPILVRAGALLTVLCLLLASSATLAGSNVTDLGRPSNEVPPAGTLGGFRHAGPLLRQGRTPELLFIGTYIEGDSAAERWPVVKALSQFGSFSNISATTTRPCIVRINVLDCTVHPGVSGYPTFDWQSARYRSRYVTFAHRDVINRDLQARQKLQPVELALFNRYIRSAPSGTWQDAAYQAAIHGTPTWGGGPLPDRRFPLVSVGGYLEVGAQIAIVGDLFQKQNTFPTSFDVVQKSLQRGRAVGDVEASLVPDFNEEANIITALICRADGSQPRRVCGRKAISKILKRVRHLHQIPEG